ncbi:hypothetical protein EST38_g7595 [Candolleomyces aberdarensis]|uniref:UDENN domain-containing protein n=1 Tax=Candolleomyces aberdarensis TaxID=2316362 RepID=A0A4Q2DER1_9AGAR|nr:hypothetical protein EST38_g7595 [Candolleomyces aberdarensis]
MTNTPSGFNPPEDIVAIFHASFHPTRGNVLDWYFSADENIDFENLGLEYSALPSGLHQIDEDVVYFTTPAKFKTETSTPQATDFHALAVFRRRRTPHPLYRGFLLGSLGILVRPPHPRPWRHLQDLRPVAERCYSRPGSEPSSDADGKLIDIDSPGVEEWFEPAKEFFEARKFKGSVDERLVNWKDDLHDQVRFWLSRASATPPTTLNYVSPTLFLPSLLTLLGPDSLTLYRQLLTRKRILFYTKPPVEYACALCYAAMDMVKGIQQQEWVYEGYKDDEAEDVKMSILSKNAEPARVLGMVTLHDLLSTKLEDSETGQGWIACTTDALFLEKPSYYDLLIDLTSVGVSSSSTTAFTTKSSSPPSAGPSSTAPTAGRPRPLMYVSVPKQRIGVPLPAKKGKGKQPKLDYKRLQTRWAWSDARLWGDLDKVLKVPAVTSTPTQEAPASSSSSSTAAAEDPGASNNGSTPTATTTTKPANGAQQWIAEIWQLYEDVCLVCAGAWMGTLRNRNGGYDSTLDSADDIDIDLSNTNSDHNTNSENDSNNLNPNSNSGSPPVAIRGLTLKRSFSTPNPGARGGAGRRGGRYNSITMPSVRSSSGFSRKKGATTGGKHPRSASSGGAAACDHEHPEHDFMLVPPPTLDTREGLDILLHTSDNSGKGTGNLNLADALSKTEGVLGVLDSYAAWAVGVLRGKVGDVVREGKGKSGEEEEGVDGEASSESDADVEEARANAGQEPEEGNIRTSAIELTPSGGIGFTRRPTPPPPATSSSILPFGKKKNKSKKSKKMTLTMYPRDLLSLDLNPLSGSDVKYLEGVVGEYASRVVVSSPGTGAKAPAASEQQEPSSSGEATQEVRVKLVVKRGWRDLVGVVFGL